MPFICWTCQFHTHMRRCQLGTPWFHVWSSAWCAKILGIIGLIVLCIIQSCMVQFTSCTTNSIFHSAWPLSMLIRSRPSYLVSASLFHCHSYATICMSSGAGWLFVWFKQLRSIPVSTSHIWIHYTSYLVMAAYDSMTSTTHTSTQTTLQLSHSGIGSAAHLCHTMSMRRRERLKRRVKRSQRRPTKSNHHSIDSASLFPFLFIHHSSCRLLLPWRNTLLCFLRLFIQYQ